MEPDHRGEAQDPALTPALLLAAYSQGLFPMASARDVSGVSWYQSATPAILPLETFHCPRSVRQRMQQGDLEVRFDTAFEQVVRACAEPRPSQPETWINDQIITAYTELHRMGHAHSVEAWADDRLVGGLYGVTLGTAFFGESMFHILEPIGNGASKVCLVHLVERLKARGFTLLDAQMQSPLLEQFGACEITRQAYAKRLAEALEGEATWE